MVRAVMRVSRQLVLWGLAVGFAVAAGSTAVAAVGPRAGILTATQVGADLAEARASARPARAESTLKPDEWAGLLPSAGITARCVGTRMEVTDWSQATTWTRALTVHPGPADTVSLSYRFGHEGSRVTATGRCVDGLPTGTYLLGDEPAQQITFGKWVDSGITGCAASDSRPLDPENCQEVPIMALSAAPQPG